jgi:apolipoprotein D and lipocalin family protein
MRRIAVAAALTFFITSSAWAQTDSTRVRSVDRVDLERYAGLWYEIAHIPNRFQRDCVLGTTARYALRDDGKIDVINQCYRENGKRKRAKGLARIVEGSSNSQLEVSFFKLLFFRPVWGDYWILGLDSDYRWAVIGTPDRKYGWILSREPALEPSDREQIERILREQGYDPESFKPTAHSPA